MMYLDSEERILYLKKKILLEHKKEDKNREGIEYTIRFSEEPPLNTISALYELEQKGFIENYALTFLWGKEHIAQKLSGTDKYKVNYWIQQEHPDLMEMREATFKICNLDDINKSIIDELILFQNDSLLKDCSNRYTNENRYGYTKQKQILLRELGKLYKETENTMLSIKCRKINSLKLKIDLLRILLSAEKENYFEIKSLTNPRNDDGWLDPYDDVVVTICLNKVKINELISTIKENDKNDNQTIKQVGNILKLQKNEKVLCKDKPIDLDEKYIKVLRESIKTYTSAFKYSEVYPKGVPSIETVSKYVSSINTYLKQMNAGYKIKRKKVVEETCWYLDKT